VREISREGRKRESGESDDLKCRDERVEAMVQSAM
jgi:hypothetical protein